MARLKDKSGRRARQKRERERQKAQKMARALSVGASVSRRAKKRAKRPDPAAIRQYALEHGMTMKEAKKAMGLKSGK